MEDVTTVIKRLDPSIPSNSIRDCMCLDKYTKRSRQPILVKLSRSCEVIVIQANRKRLIDTPGISIKPDLSKEERLTKSVLLKVHWELINSGMEGKRINIRGRSLYLDNQLRGSVVTSKYVPRDSNEHPPNHKATSGANQQSDPD